MRADRLLSILMLLQARGRLTAQALADELEVSVRTIYRDVDALSFAGVPVYTDRGPGGGISLLDSYRTTLTGLTRDEARALFMMSIPAPLADLGLSDELGAALRKLAAALPTARRGDDQRVRQRIHLDPVGWHGSHRPVPHLETIHGAVWEDRLLDLTYQLRFETRAEWQVAPYGLVAKSGVWHLVCSRNGSTRVLELSRVLEARVLDISFQRPDGFDLARFWTAWCESYEENRPTYPVKLRVSPRWAPYLSLVFGEWTNPNPASSGSPEEWATLEVDLESLDKARGRILALGGGVEVLEPPALRNSVHDFALQIQVTYGSQMP